MGNIALLQLTHRQTGFPGIGSAHKDPFCSSSAAEDTLAERCQFNEVCENSKTLNSSQGLFISSLEEEFKMG